MAGVDEVDRGEQLTRRHRGLEPGCAIVIGIDDMPACPNGHKAITGMRNVKQERSARLERHDGWFEFNAGSLCLRQSGRRADEQCAGEAQRQCNSA
ncbi:hypothetical protein GCM10009083_11680 [Halopseudomonas pertucinogena]|uniref:Transposase IS701-like DDE domain-containing protein n=1 Tax=Halopseudomonas pertucinogena TaxID=86175 RepID=A0ABQ2CP98_9GAMM|nr:hypothetical protein GCM10009083_11680 [Halopseudomonas pertucinogena]